MMYCQKKKKKKKVKMAEKVLPDDETAIQKYEELILSKSHVSSQIERGLALIINFHGFLVLFSLSRKSDLFQCKLSNAISIDHANAKDALRSESKKTF